MLFFFCSTPNRWGCGGGIAAGPCRGGGRSRCAGAQPLLLLLLPLLVLVVVLLPVPVLVVVVVAFLLSVAVAVVE